MSGISMPPGDPAAIEDAAGQLRSYGSQIATLADSTRSTSSRIATTADWTGSSADAYRSFTGSLASAIARMEEPLQGIPSAAGRYADALKNAQAKVQAYQSHVKQVSSITGPVSPQEQAQNAATLKTLEQDAELALEALETQANGFVNFLKDLGDTLKDVFAPEGPFREWLETITRPWDTVGGDAILEGFIQKGERLERAFDAAKDAHDASLQSAIDSDFDDIVGTVAQEYDAGNASLEDLDNAYKNFETVSQWLTEGAAATAPEEPAGALTKMMPFLENFGRVADVLGIVGGTYTAIDPPEYDHGDMRTVARVAGGAMAAGSAVGLASSFGLLGGSLLIPGVGEGVAAAAGMYLAGDYIYHHTHQIAHMYDTARHAVAHYADDLVSWM